MTEKGVPQTHSIIITFQLYAIVWYPNNPHLYWHYIDEDGIINPIHFRTEHNPLTATQFIEHYAEGTE